DLVRGEGVTGGRAVQRGREDDAVHAAVRGQQRPTGVPRLDLAADGVDLTVDLAGVVDVRAAGGLPGADAGGVHRERLVLRETGDDRVVADARLAGELQRRRPQPRHVQDGDVPPRVVQHDPAPARLAGHGRHTGRAAGAG